MPILANARHEVFAQEIAKGKSATEAMKIAGIADPRNSTRLTKNDEIAARIVELQSKVAAKAEITLETLLGFAEEARALAMTLKQPGAAVAAVKEMGVLSGVRVEKRENTNKSSLAQMTDAELEAIAAGRGEDTASSARGSSVTH